MPSSKVINSLSSTTCFIKLCILAAKLDDFGRNAIVQISR